MTKPKHSESIISNDEWCYISGTTQELDRHHIMNGPFREKAEKYGLWVYLNHEVHMWLHQTKDGQVMMKRLKQVAQRRFEAIHGHDLWMQEFKRNYL